MAKHGRRRKFRRYIKGRIDESNQLSTLGPKVVIGFNADDTVNDSAWLSSVKLTHSLKQYTNTASAGPILVGVCHSDYADSEIEQWLEFGGTWDTGNLISQEIAKRKIRQIGVFRTEDTSGTGPNTNYVLNEGRPITTKCGWMLAEGDTAKLWYYNSGAVAFATTNPSVIAIGHANLWPTG